MTPETRAWLEITRVSNLPTVLGGVLVSVAATGVLQWQFRDWALMGWWSPQLAMLAAIACFYMAGFILNDVFDRRIDREERPGRPIPSGRIMVGTAVKVAVIMILAGLLLVGFVAAHLGEMDVPFSPAGIAAAVLLVILIVLYNRLHLTGSWTVFLMGGCRAMVYVTCIMAMIGYAHQSTAWQRYISFNAMVYWPLLPFIIGIFLYVSGFSRIARGEVPAEGEERFCQQCGYPCPTGSANCTECGIEIDPQQLERSSSPPLKRGLENLCLASTFIPSGLLLGLGCYWFGENLYFARLVTSEEFWKYFSPQLIKILTSGIISLFSIGWLVIATRRYRSDRTRPTRSILMWIAAIPLMDANLSVYLQLPLWISLACLGLFFLTVWGHRRITGT